MRGTFRACGVAAAWVVAFACGGGLDTGQAGGAADAAGAPQGDGASADATGSDDAAAAEGGRSDGATTTVSDGALADGACVLPANTCEDANHLRVRKNLRAEGGCSWDEEVVACQDLGGEICVGNTCTVVLR